MNTIEDQAETPGAAPAGGRRRARGAGRRRDQSGDPTTVAMEDVASDLVGALVTRLNGGSGEEAA
jgi:hypothetical protein